MSQDAGARAASPARTEALYMEPARPIPHLAPFTLVSTRVLPSFVNTLALQTQRTQTVTTHLSKTRHSLAYSHN